MDAPAPQPDADYYSPSATITTFDRPLPLLRVPIPAGNADSPSSGPFVLAFKNSQSWTAAYKACESKLTSQCEAGARIGCAITASSKCKAPWWKSLLSKPDFAERERCEERETAACFEAAKAKCGQFAKEKCEPVFRDARIAVEGRRVDWKEASKLMFWATAAAERKLGFGLIGLERMGSWDEFKDRVEVTNYRGSELLATVTD